MAPAAAKTISDSVSTKIGSQAAVEIEPVDDQHDHHAAEQADDDAEAHLLQEAEASMPGH
jgi:hypothetical protein